MDRKLVLAAPGMLVPHYLGEKMIKGRALHVFSRRQSRDGAGNSRFTALFICDRGLWDNGTKQVVRPGPVSVPWCEFYERQVASGSLVIVESKVSAKAESKASRGSDAARDSAGGKN
jgi:hypothetical protein